MSHGSYIGIDNNIRCDFFDCIAGLGLAGSGFCWLWGIPWHHSCPRFESNEEWEKEGGNGNLD